MAIFNLKYINSLLLEMKNKEEYSRKSFKKKYNFKPDKDNKNIGKIKVDGKEYRIDMDKTKDIKDDDGEHKRRTGALKNDDNNTIYLDKKFFKLKGSDNNERRDAVLQHEIGHHKNETSSSKDHRPNRLKELDKAQKMAKKYDKSDLPNQEHTNYNEILADRYAADRTSKSSIKKAVRNIYKINRKEENDKNNHDLNKRMELDYKQRSKALNDNELKKQYNKYISDNDIHIKGLK